MAAFLEIVGIALLVGADQAVKAWATSTLAPAGALPLWPGVAELRYVRNSGAAFSLLAGKQGFLILFTACLLAGVGWMLFLRKERPGTLERIGLVLILAGGLGNLIDRVRAGEVVDYINLLFMDFAVFNFADICVCVGVGLVILAILFTPEGRKES